MKFDVSEIKTFKTCKRQWQLSSRNQFHLVPIIQPAHFTFGTIFHEALAQMYLGVPYEKVMDMVKREMQTDNDAALLAMVNGYYKNVLPDDLDRFKVLDIEHHFEIAPTTSEGEYLFDLVPAKDEKGQPRYYSNGDPVMESSVTIVGSIDMIALDVAENKIYGFEHKTCKSFRDEAYLWMDEQPRVYTWALQQYVNEYNVKQEQQWLKAMQTWGNEGCDINKKPARPQPATLGGIYLNEVKKLLRQFQYNRTLCTYTEEDLDNFLQAFFVGAHRAVHIVRLRKN